MSLEREHASLRTSLWFLETLCSAQSAGGGSADSVCSRLFREAVMLLRRSCGGVWGVSYPTSRIRKLRHKDGSKKLSRLVTTGG